MTSVSTTEEDDTPGFEKGYLVEIVVPVYNEAGKVETSVSRLRSFLDRSFPFSSLVTIADNASTDGTDRLAQDLAGRLDGVRAVHLAERGRGRALKATWLSSRAAVVAYMDADLATGLEALVPLVAPLLAGEGELAIGSRLAGGARVVRGPKREFISRAYNFLVRLALGTRFSDAQCGFKALRSETARELLPLVEDEGWFFDTELLVLAERRGLRIHEVPVDWVDDPDSRVDIVRTALDDLRGIWRLRHSWAGPPAARRSHRGDRALAWGFAGVGILSTVAYLALFLALAPHLGHYGSNAVALALCTLAKTWTLTITARDRRPGSAETAAGALVSLGVLFALTSAALAISHLLDPGSTAFEVVALLGASALAALLRFTAVQTWSSRRYGREMAGGRLERTKVAA